MQEGAAGRVTGWSLLPPLAWHPAKSPDIIRTETARPARAGLKLFFIGGDLLFQFFALSLKRGQLLGLEAVGLLLGHLIPLHCRDLGPEFCLSTARRSIQPALEVGRAEA